MFRRLLDPDRPVTFEFEGELVTAQEGEMLSGALLAKGLDYMHDAIISGEPRSGYCMIGVCFDCLVEIDGRPNRQACQTPVRAGMKVRRQRAPGNGVAT